MPSLEKPPSTRQVRDLGLLGNEIDLAEDIQVDV